MKDKISNYVLENLFIIIILFACILVLSFNYKHNTWLSGWDTLHHEFNFGFNIKRDLYNGIWREYQGLGSVAGHSHISDIPRQLILLFLSLLFPLNFLRYFVIFITFPIGAIGMYRLLEYLLLAENKSFNHKLAAFIGSLYYIFNLGTLQIFNVPFEMFNFQFALLPFIFLYSLRYIKFKNTKDLVKFTIVAIFISPSAYAATLFYMFFICFVIFNLTHFLTLFILSRIRVKNLSIISQDIDLKAIIFIIIILLFSNLYWILPNLYFVKNHSFEVSKTNINFNFSPEAFVKNKQFGNFKDLLIHKNFLFDWKIYNFEKNEFEQVLKPWLDFYSVNIVNSLNYVFVVFLITGIIFSYKRSFRFFSFVILFFFTLFFLLTDNPPLGFIFSFIQNNFPVLKEALRFPYTKFGNIYLFSYTIITAYGVYIFIEHFKNIKFIIISALFSFLIIIYFPAFEGNLVNSNIKISYPDYYFKLFEKLNSLEKGRVLILPAHTMWAWQYYDWGYQGSGFMQFGIDMPIIDRDFDRWNIYNEQLFNELTNILYTNDAKKFSDFLNKYNISYIVYDPHIIYPSQPLPLDYMERMYNLVENYNLISDYGNGEKKILLLDTNIKNENLISAIKVEHNSKFLKSDLIFNKFSNYFSSSSTTPQDDILSYNNRFNSDILNEKYNKNDLLALYELQSINPYRFKIEKITTNSNEEVNYTNELVISTGFENLSNEIKNEFMTIPLDESTKIIKISDGYTSRTIYNNTTSPTIEALLDKNFVLTLYGISEENSFEYTLTNPSIDNCGSEESLSYGYFIDKDTISLESNSNELCLVFDNLPPGKFIIDFGELKSQNLVSIKFCNNELCTDSSLVLDNNSSYNKAKIKISKNLYSGFPELNVPKLIKITPLREIFINGWEIYNNLPENTETDLNLYREAFKYNFKFSEFDINSCGPELPKYTIDTGNFNKINLENGAICIIKNLKLPYVKNFNYVLKINSNNLTGLPLRFCLYSLDIGNCILYSTLAGGIEEILAHKNFDNENIKFEFISLAPNGVVTSNEVIGDLELYPIPLDFLIYKGVDIEQNKNYKIFTNWQSFESGWLMFCGYKLCNAEHVLVNNWANGWVFSENENINTENVRFIFWPQILQYIGYLFLFVVVLKVYLIVRKNI